MFIRKPLATLIFFGVITTAIFFSACKKSNTTPGGTSGAGVMQPVSVSFYEGNNAGYPETWDYTYNNDNLLVKYGKENNWLKEIGVHGVTLTTYGSFAIYSTDYAYSIANQLDTAVNIYAQSPSKLTITLNYKNLNTNSVTQTPQGYYIMTANARQQLLDMDFSGGTAFKYAYDDKGNLSTVNFYQSGISGAGPYGRLTVNAVDDKPSPFSAVKGYNFIAWPVAYPDQYALAYCKNNPLKITEEDAVPGGGWKVYRITSFAYVYNEQGYPTKVTVTTENPGAAVPTTYYKTYNYTYKAL